MVGNESLDADGLTRRCVIQLSGVALALPAAPFEFSYPENQRMSFTPKFVDLVRNYSTTTGTGNFTLGQAVSGYTGFASALQPGDSFYYSALGVDKPAEREVGRGTLQANGTISRDPVTGMKTNFTTGTKTIALIAAAEWFNNVQTQGTAGTAVAAGRSALAAMSSNAFILLTEPGREGLFRFDNSNLSAKVAADTAQGIYVAPAPDPTGGSGAWVRQFDGPVLSTWFGVSASNTAAANSAAIAAAIATIDALEVGGVYYGSGGPHLHFPVGRFQFDAPITPTTSMEISGELAAADGGTVLHFVNNTSGIAPAPFNARVNVHNLVLRGSFAGANGAAHGLQVRTRMTARDLTIMNFSGDGINVEASVVGGTGNANGCHFENIMIVACRNGTYANGDDANAMMFLNVSCFDNRLGGHLDSSGTGNTYIGGDMSNNGMTAGFATRCSHGGNIYAVIWGQEAWASANAPSGTTAHNTGWMYVEPGAPNTFAPAWSAGQTWHFSAPYGNDGNSGNHRGLFQAIYVEGGQNPCIVMARTLCIPGLTSAAIRRMNGDVSGNVLAADEGINVSGVFAVNRINAGEVYATSAIGSVNAITAGGMTPGDVGAGVNLLFDGTWGQVIGYDWGAAAYKNMAIIGTVVQLKSGATLVATVESGGFNLASGKVLQVNGTTVVDGSGNIAVGRIQVAAAGKLLARFTAGAGAAEEAGLANGLQFAGGNLGLGAITPTSMAATGAITTSGGGVGYSAGAGGTAVQATNKGTGVTLNKLCGEITMSAAALAANSAVTFTLTNTTIEPGDRIVLNHKSGGTFGAYLLDARAATGSATVVVRNVTSGSLSEAIVIGFAVIKAVNA